MWVSRIYLTILLGVFINNKGGSISPESERVRTQGTSSLTSDTTQDPTSFNIWYVSDYGSDDNDCRTESAPCKNLQTLLDRATDGADIYVTSDTLSLNSNTDQVWVDVFESYFPCCSLRSSVSYSISSMRGANVDVKCSETEIYIHWILSDHLCVSRGIPSMKIENLVFNRSTFFTLHGLASFVSCTFGWEPLRQSPWFLFNVYRSECEAVVSHETFSSFHLYAKGHKISIVRSQVGFAGRIQNIHFYIYLGDVARRIDISNCNIEYTNVKIDIRCKLSSKDCSCSSVADVLFDNTTIISSYVEIYPHSQGSFGLMRFRNVKMTHSEIVTIEKYGVIFTDFENCNLHETAVSMYALAYLKITNCTFSISHENQLTRSRAISANGHEPEFWELARSLFCSTIVCHVLACSGVLKNKTDFQYGYPILYIEGTYFVGVGSVIGDSIHVKDAHLVLENSVFVFTVNKVIPPACAFINVDGSYCLKVTNTTFDTTALSSSKSEISTVCFTGLSVRFHNVHMLCPIAYYVAEKRPKFRFLSREYLCEQKCDQNKYSLQAGDSFLTGDTNKNVSSSFEVHKTVPVCILCPVGANCTTTIRSLPDYWGFRDLSGFMKMIRCPKRYCCSNHTTCKGIDSCNNKRTGNLCGICEKNYTESLFSPDCKLFELCHGGLIIGLYLFCVIVYALILMFLGQVKDKILDFVKRGFQSLKRKLRPFMVNCNQGHDHELKEVNAPSGSENMRCPSSEKEQESGSDDGMKYIQILLYYAQDASLFKVTLPIGGQQTESTIVKILQFSPEILTTVYTKITDLCFMHGTTAVTKIFVKSLFGPCVMLFLFLVYIGQKVLSGFVCKSSKIWRSLEACLIRAYLLAILFSFQQITAGVFTLVQCVDVGGNKVLYVQGEIECYAWWQIIIKIYVCINTIPGFMVLSHVPFYIRDRKMSLKTFILACIFPVPVMVFYHLSRKFQTRKQIVTKVNTMIEHGSSEIGTGIGDVRIEQPQTHDYTGARERRSSSGDTEGVHEQIYVSIDDCSDTDLGSLYSVDVSPNREKRTDRKLYRRELKDSSDSDVDMEDNGSDLSDNNFGNKTEHSDTEQEVIDTLLKHYKCLSVFGVRFTWLGIHKLYRVMLVAANTYITEPLTRLYLMTAMLIVITVINSFVQPYKDSRANKTATLSYAANICIAMISLFKAGLEKYGCHINCPELDTFLGYMNICENILLVYTPVAAVSLWSFHTGVQKCRGKSKDD